LLGLSGTGKSTLLNAFARLGQADGIIFFGNRRLHDIGEHELRRMLAIVSQRPRIFHGTIADAALNGLLTEAGGRRNGATGSA